MTASILDQQELTADQQIALDMVRNQPGMTVEDYASLPNAECDERIYPALLWLNFNRYITIDPNTQAVTVKG